MAQGVCDLDVPPQVIRGAKKAMDDGNNIYTSCKGVPVLRQAIAAKMKKMYDLDVDPDGEVFVSAGATGAFYSAALAVLDPGDEVLLFEPFYGYHAATISAIGCLPRFLPLHSPAWGFSREDLNRFRSKKLKAIVVNTPSNPLGKVFGREELETVASFAIENNLLVFTDEIYESFVYDGLEHIPLLTIPGMRERTITISGFSKIFSITGWRLGWAICPPELTEAASSFNDLVYVCAPSPLQFGAALGVLELGPEYYASVAMEHQKKRDQFCAALVEAHMPPVVPQGAYYVLADVSKVPGGDDKEKVMNILKNTGIASVPGRAFYHDGSDRAVARFCFAKKQEILDEACGRLKGMIAGMNLI